MKLQKKKSGITQSLSFTEFDFLQVYRWSFEKSELVRIHAQLPIKKLAQEIVVTVIDYVPLAIIFLYTPVIVCCSTHRPILSGLIMCRNRSVEHTSGV